MLTHATVETALERMLAQHFALGRFDPAASNPYRQIPISAVGKYYRAQSRAVLSHWK
jgi:hypothetical protein